MDELTGRAIHAFEQAEQGQILGEMKEVLTSLQLQADERLAIYQISYKQGVPLKYLNRRTSLNVTELAAAAEIHAGAMTRMLERLEAKGLLERRRSSSDRRIVDVRLLEPGAAVAAEIDDLLGGVEEDHLKDFSLQERARLREFLERMRVNGRAPTDG